MMVISVKKTKFYKRGRNCIKRNFDLLKFHYLIKYNKTVKAQIINPLSIPIVIVSFNQLYYLEKLVSRLERVGHSYIMILDNGSTYPPLLDYLRKVQSENITVEMRKLNDGHLSFWRNKDIYERIAKGFYVVTDPDILPLKVCPDNFVEQCLTVLLKNKSYTKVGLSLSLEAIPLYYKFKDKVIKWESQFWEEDLDLGYIAEVDTTFALYKPQYIYNPVTFFKGIRLKSPYTALHGGWNIDYDNLTEEQIYYINHANSSSSWISKDGINILNDNY